MKNEWVRDGNSWRIKRLCFLNSTITWSVQGGYYTPYCHPRVEMKSTLCDMKKAVEQYVYQQCTAILIHSDDELYSKLINGNLTIKYHEWCNNIGCGKYRTTWKDYHWLSGRWFYQGVSNNYSIRFDKSTPKEEVIKKGVVLLKRECNRYTKT